MLYKLRTKPNELAILEALDKRMNLKKEDKRRHYNLKKGYEGEVRFDSLTEKLKCECLILNDLLFTQSHTTFQLDTLMIGHGKIHLYDVKNHEGDHYYESGHLYNNAGIKLNNPLHQLTRSESLLQKLLFNLGHNYLLSPSIVFINSSFTMYQAPRDQPIIHPTQIKTHLSRLNNTPSKITEQHLHLVDQLIALHQTESQFAQIPNYEYSILRKGIACIKCNSSLKPTPKKSFVCERCGHTEDVSDAVLKSVEDFRVLFPNEKITSSIIYDWCKIIEQKRIRQILLKHLKKIGNRRWTYFE